MKKDTRVPAPLMMAALPPELFRRAIKAAEEQSIDTEGNAVWDVMVDEIHASIGFGFKWDKTEEGHKFWQIMHYAIFQYEVEEY